MLNSRPRSTIKVAVLTGMLVVVACLAGTPPAAPSPAAARMIHHPCGKRALVVKAGRHRGCVSRLVLAAVMRAPRTVRAMQGEQAALLITLLRGVLPGDVPAALAGRPTNDLAHRLASESAMSALFGSFAGRGAAPRAAPSTAAGSSFTKIEPQPGELGSGGTATATATNAEGVQGTQTSSETSFARGCPDASGYLMAHGSYTFHYHAVMNLPHRLRTIADVRIEAHVHATGHVGEDAKLRTYDAVTAVSFVGDGRTLGPAGLIHGEVKHESWRGRMVFVGLDPHSNSGSLSAQHIGSFSLDGAAADYTFGPGDAFHTGSRSVDTTAALSNIQLHNLTSHAWPESEHNFDAGARCLKAIISPDPLTVTVRTAKSMTLVVRSTETAQPAPIRVALSTAYLRGGTVSPTSLDVRASAPGQFIYTAPAKPVKDFIFVTGTSRRGRLQGSLDFSVSEDFPYYYKVLAAKLVTHADGQYQGGADVCTSAGYPTGGAEDFNGTTGAFGFRPDNSLAQPSGAGPLTGHVFADVPAYRDIAVRGCVIHSDGTTTPCHQTLPRQYPRPGGTATIGFSISAASRSASTATLGWSVPDPEVGIAAGGGDPNTYCHARYLTQGVAYQQTTQQVPMALLAGNQPQTLTFNGGPVNWSQDAIGTRIALTYQWQYTITIQRVNAQGGPVQ